MIHRYSSRRSPLKDFLAARLQGARRYDRIAGFFSSSLLEVAGEKNRGQTYTFDKLMSMEISRQGDGSRGKQAFCQKCRRDPGLCFCWIDSR